MINFFKKKEESETKNLFNKDSNSNEDHLFYPPRTLPELAKDLYDSEKPQIKELPNSNFKEKAFSNENKLSSGNKQPIENVSKSFANYLQDFESFSSSKELNNKNVFLNKVNINESAPKDKFNVEEQNTEKTKNQNNVFDGHMFEKNIESFNSNTNLNSFKSNKISNIKSNFDLRGDFLFDYIEFLISQNRTEELKEILSNTSYYLNDFHKQKLSDLKNLEIVWVYLKNKKELLSNLFYELDLEIANKSKEIIYNSINESYNSINDSINHSFSMNKNEQNCENNEETKNNEEKIFANDVASLNIDKYSDIKFSKKKSNDINANDLSEIFYFRNAFEKNIEDSSKFFYVCNGVVVKSLKDLIKELETMPDDAFYFHINNKGNDFANWLEHIFNLKNIANKLRQISSKKEAVFYLKSLLSNNFI